MQTQKFDVDHFAKLARLELNNEEKVEMQQQMTNILDMVQTLMELPLDNVEGTNFAVKMTNVIRPDTILDSIPVEEVVKTFPNSSENSCKVPVILGEE